MYELNGNIFFANYFSKQQLKVLNEELKSKLGEFE